MLKYPFVLVWTSEVYTVNYMIKESTNQYMLFSLWNTSEFLQFGCQGTRQGLDFQIFQVIRQYLTLPKFWQVICLFLFLYLVCATNQKKYSIQVCPAAAFSLKFFSQQIFVSYFHFIIQRLSLFSYHRPSHWLSSGVHCCKSRIQHLVQLHWFRLFQVCDLKRSFTLSLDAINDCNWSFCFLYITDLWHSYAIWSHYLPFAVT